MQLTLNFVLIFSVFTLAVNAVPDIDSIIQGKSNFFCPVADMSDLPYHNSRLGRCLLDRGLA